jgi:hypothetical protein
VRKVRRCPNGLLILNGFYTFETWEAVATDVLLIATNIQMDRRKWKG